MQHEMRLLVIGLLFQCATGAALAAPQNQPTSAPATEESDDAERITVVKAGTILTGAGKPIKNGLIVIRGAKIENVGTGIDYPRNATVIDASDRVVMPGLIDPATRFSLSPYSRSGVHANLTVADEYTPRDGRFDDLLDAGYTCVALIPAGGGIPGRALVIRTAGDAAAGTLLDPGYVRIAAGKAELRGALDKAQAEIDKVEKARKDFEAKQKKQADSGKKQPQPKPKPAARAKQPPATQPASQPTSAPASQPAFKPPPIDPAFQPLVDLIQKKDGLFALIEFTNASDLLHFDQVLKKHEIAHHFAIRNRTQSDLLYVVDSLGERKAQIVVRPYVGRIPYSAERINLMRELDQAGCEVTCAPVSDSARSHREMLARLAELVRAGWSRDAALASVTLHPARLLGLEKRLGSIEKGKDADLIFLDADPLDPRARVRSVMIAGRVVHTVEAPK